MALVFILLVALVLYFYLSSSSRNKPRSSDRRIHVNKQQIQTLSDADIEGVDGDADDGHIETVQVHEGDEDELDLEPQQKQPPRPQRRPSPSSQRGFPTPSPPQHRLPPLFQRVLPTQSVVPSPSRRPPPSLTDDFPPPAAAPPSGGGGVVVERGLPPEEWGNFPAPIPNPFGGFLNGEYPWIGEGYDKFGSFERYPGLPEHIRKNIELIAGPGNGIEDFFSDDNVHGCSIM